MAWTLVNHDAVGFADGNAGHGTPSAGDLVSTPSGFTLAVTFVNSQGSYIWLD